MSRSNADSLEALKLLRDQLIDRITEVTLNPQVNYSVSTKNGSESFDFTSYLKMLFGELEGILKVINMLNPYVITTRQYL